MRTYFFNKCISLVLLMLFVVTPIFLANPNRANAQFLAVPVSDGPLELKETGFSIFGVPTGISLDGLAFIAANLIIARITDSIVSWINTGFQGSPAFIQDPGGWFVETADMASGALFEELGVADFLCTPFAPIRAALVWNYQQKKFTRDYKCKLSDVAGNFNNFVSGDFNGQGGWDQWFNITQNPSNNPFGVYIGAQIEMDSRIAKAVGLENNKLDWGKGFLSIQKCKVEDPSLPHGCKEYYPIETPGSVVEAQLNNTLDSEGRRINVADEMNEILSALANQLVTHVFQGGLSHASGGGTIDPNGSSDFTVSCAVNPTDPIFLNTQSQISQPVIFSASVVGGVGPATFAWVLSGSPSPAGPATTINLTAQSVTPVTYSALGVGPQTARVSVTKDTGAGLTTKYATCNINVLSDPPLKIESCSVSPSVIRWQYNNTPAPGYINPTWSVFASGGALAPSTTTPSTDMGYCIFDWTTSAGWHWVITSPLVGSPAGSRCDLTTYYQTHGQSSGNIFTSVTIHSGTQTTGSTRL
jgi:hypothetical protein